MRVAFYSPLPPERTGIGDYSFELLEVLRERLDVAAIVADERLDRAQAPDGVELIGAAAVDPAAYDCAIYQMGNNSRYHRFVFTRALEVPGLLVMHDPSLADFHAEICGGATSVVFQDEMAYDSPGADPLDLPRVEIGRGMRDLDRLAVPLARRIVTSSLRTLVNSGAMAEEYRVRYPGADIASIRLPAQVVHARGDAGRPAPGAPVRIGVFGGINYYKRVRSAVDAFVRLHAEVPSARLVVAGRPDDRRLTEEIRKISRRPELGGALELKTDLTLDELEQEMARCDVALQLRWPTAGEMSATLMRTFGAGRPAVVTDVAQFRDLDATFCWRVPHEEEREVDALLAVMRAVAADPGAAWQAGQTARAFVAAEATYEHVADAYVAHVTDCAPAYARARDTHHNVHAPRPGVNVVVPTTARVEVTEAGRALVRVLDRWRVDAPLVTIEAPGREIDPPSQRPRPVKQLPWPPPNRHAARRFSTAWTAERGPYDVDVLVVDASLAPALLEYAVSERRRERVVVAYVGPEALPVPNHLLPLLFEVDAIWASSDFAADVLQPHSLSEVLVVPLTGAISVTTPAPPRADDGVCRFVCIVDASVGITRTGVRSAISAYTEAFDEVQRRSTVAMEIAVVHGALSERAMTLLNAEATDAGATISVCVTERDRREAIAAADVVVGAHRSDPYGLALAEAAALGRSAVVTSGFGTPTFLKGAAFEVAPGAAHLWRGDLYLDDGTNRRFMDGQWWSAVDVASLARRFREAASYPGRRRDIATRARAAWEACSVAELAMADAINERVRALHPSVAGTLAQRTRARGHRSPTPPSSGS